MNNNFIFPAEIFQSGMVLQRDKDITIWGTTAADLKIQATLTDSEGNRLAESSNITIEKSFTLTLPPQSVARDLTLTISAESENVPDIVLTDVAVGDVWLAGGQSNMEFFLKYDEDWDTTMSLPKIPDIRMYNVPQRAFEGHTSHGPVGYGYWLKEGDEGFENFSAPAYSFARHIHSEVDIPIGLVGCNWGGSTASAWVPEEVLSKSPLDLYLNEYNEAVKGIDPEKIKEDSLAGWAHDDAPENSKEFEPVLYGIGREEQLIYIKEHAGNPVIPMGPYNMNRPSGLYHTMLEKIIPFGLKGALWYQGESDCGNRASIYDKLLTAMIEDWRSEWQDSFPFYIVQLAPFGVWLECGNEEYKVVRQMQRKVADTVPDVYMASIMDIGSYYDIHPKKKMEVGRRLALLALNHTYKKEVLGASPVYKDLLIHGNHQIKVRFTYADGLHKSEGHTDFWISKDNEIVAATKRNSDDLPTGAAGSDAIVISQNAQYALTYEVIDDSVVIDLPDEVTIAPGKMTLSCGYADYAEINVHNEAGLPIEPFEISF